MPSILEFYHIIDMTALNFPMIFCPGWWITQLPLSAETQELNHERQFHNQYGNFIQEYMRSYKWGYRGGFAGSNVTFYPQETLEGEKKAGISGSVWQQRVSVRKWTIGHFYLLALMLARREMEVQGRLWRNEKVRGVGFE